MAEARTRNSPRVAVGLDTGRESKVKQAPAEDCDINAMMKSYQKTGRLPAGLGIGRYGDFYEVEDYMDALLKVKSAELQFASLPATVRDRFNNDPGTMLAFVMDKANLAEAQRLGLLKEEVKEPVVAPVAPVVEPTK